MGGSPQQGRIDRINDCGLAATGPPGVVGEGVAGAQQQDPGPAARDQRLHDDADAVLDASGRPRYSLSLTTGTTITGIWRQPQGDDCLATVVQRQSEGVPYNYRVIVMADGSGYLYLQEDADDLTIGWLERDG